MFRSIKKMFITTIACIGLNVYNAMSAMITLKFISMSNQECSARPAIVNINSNDTLFYLYGVTFKKVSGSCNDIK